MSFATVVCDLAENPSQTSLDDNELDNTPIGPSMSGVEDFHVNAENTDDEELYIGELLSSEESDTYSQTDESESYSMDNEDL